MTTADDHARTRIRADLAATMLVVAGAGTGKTTALVQRIVELVTTGTATLREIAAITFTEAAAAELRDRVRRAIDAEAKMRPDDAPLAAARHDVDEAAICTLHAFARRIITEHSVATGVPPGFEVLGDTAERADFDARWGTFADALLADPDAEPALVRGFALGLSPAALVEVARSMYAQQDRLDADALRALATAQPGRHGWPVVTTRSVVDAIDTALAYEPSCTDPDDKLAVHLRDVLVPARALLASVPVHDAADVADEAVLQALDNTPKLGCSKGQAGNWAIPVTDVRAACAAAETARSDMLDAVRRAVAADLGARLAAFVVAVAEQRRIEGKLGFGDLLVCARDLLRRDPEAARSLRRRYTRLLVDEFQDTDPIQVEIAARLAARHEGSDDVAQLRPGALFLVGDPEQSIYRFRRADIDVFGRVREQIGDVVSLRTNFRSVPGILSFVNVVFDELLGSEPVPGQAPHQDLVGERGPLSDGGQRGGAPGPNGSGSGVLGAPSGRAVQLRLELVSADEATTTDATREPAASIPGAPRVPARRGPPPVPPVILLGGPRTGSLTEIRKAAGRDVADAVARVVGDGWPVVDPIDGTLRAVRWRDVAVLLPARTALAALEEGFEDLAVPYRLEGVALLWASDDVRDVLAVLHAADDPADAVAVLAALRSPGLACGDDDLVEWHLGGGSWDPRSPAPPGMEAHPVASAMATLCRIRDERFWAEPSTVVGHALGELRAFEMCLASRRPRDHWHRLRWLWDQARLFDETGGATLRDFLRWADEEAADDRRTGGVGPPDPDDDAVRVMTIHGAKGLEFPVVVLAGLERDAGSGHRSPVVLWDDDGTPELSAGADFRTPGYALASQRDKQLDALEQDRLLYVGMTRARDHLFVCLHHKETAKGTAGARLTEICERHRELWRRPPIPEGPAVTVAVPAMARGALGEQEADAAAWHVELEAFAARRGELLHGGRFAPVATATSVAGAATGGHAVGGDRHAEPDLGPSTALQIGRAVHGALASIDPATGTDDGGRPADEVARQSAAIYGVGGQADVVVAMVATARRAPSVAGAASARHWRELYVASPVADGGVLEGFVDLVVQDPDGLVVIDYKTDRTDVAGGVTALGEHYLPQVAAYAECLEAATGQAVVRCVLVFVAGAEPIEVTYEGDALVAARRRAVESVTELLVAP